VLRVVYRVNQKFKDGNWNGAAADIRISIHSLVYQIMGVFCDRLKLGSTAPPKRALIPTRSEPSEVPCSSNK
jgi:hypothetical protein